MHFLLVQAFIFGDESFMELKTNNDELIHHVMSSVGGFLGAYALLNRHENFGSSATSNMIIIISDILGHSFKESFIRIIALLIYVFSIVLFVTIKNKTSVNVRKLSILLDGCCLVALAFLPADMDYIMSLYPIFFVTAFQWSSFINAGCFSSSTIFSTNNLRMAVSGFTSYCINKDESQLEQAKFFGLTLLYYHIGVIYSYISYKLFGIQSSFMGFLPLFAAFFIMAFQEYSVKKESNAAVENSTI